MAGKFQDRIAALGVSALPYDVAVEVEGIFEARQQDGGSLSARGVLDCSD